MPFLFAEIMKYYICFLMACQIGRGFGREQGLFEPCGGLIPVSAGTAGSLTGEKNEWIFASLYVIIYSV